MNSANPIVVALDSNIVIGLLNADDTTHHKAKLIYNSLTTSNVQQVIFDIVVTEAISVIGRRLEEKKRVLEFEQFVNQLFVFAPKNDLEWLTPRIPMLYDDCFALMRQTSGRLNFNDALIALGCRELGISHIISFDADFDEVRWLTRLK